ncbi:MAG: adenosine kinase [Sphingomonadaceae bacterium]|uniref:adenosine kinase n=1 Tax=Thermaurantiacus sp. TaxID=2820283 RepID=UPI00298F12C9|nr:adenosine kinase [Thermaurantiacus sp.]MCS6986563.1 adenosine kinase [Sphingomonadaceae bacterium]MDW8414176.1 adenosine kinase [Thermaurantiacus sp.]
MTARFDVLAIGNAIVDVIASTTDAFLAAEGIPKGSMRLVSAAEAETLYAKMGPGREVSGGSAANSCAGIAALGGRAAFIGRVSDDQLGRVFVHDIRAAGVDFRTPPTRGGPPTGQCLILVSPDGQRTMSTYLGSCQEVDEADVDEERVRAAAVTYVEGYLWDPPAPIRACTKALAIARSAGRWTALSLSDVFCVEGHRQDFLALIPRAIDLVFANENEAKALFRTDDVHTAVEGLAALAPVAVVTRSEKGAIVAARGVREAVPAYPAARVLDTTGAGDLFAAGFLVGFTRGRPLKECAVMGTIAAAEIIEHYGARPEADLKARVAAVLGEEMLADRP